MQYEAHLRADSLQDKALDYFPISQQPLSEQIQNGIQHAFLAFKMNE
jgi:hypothetical protein